MLGKELYYGKDWGEEDTVQVYPPNQDKPYWLIVISFERKREKLTIFASHATVEEENGIVSAIYY